MVSSNDLVISGFVKPSFEAVREAFIENFTHRGELGAACCIDYQGEKVVDLWGGIRYRAAGELGLLPQVLPGVLPWKNIDGAGLFNNQRPLRHGHCAGEFARVARL